MQLKGRGKPKGFAMRPDRMLAASTLYLTAPSRRGLPAYVLPFRNAEATGQHISPAPFSIDTIWR
jgi:hypothetical protein